MVKKTNKFIELMKQSIEGDIPRETKPKKKLVKIEYLKDTNDGIKKGTIEQWSLEDALLWEKEGVIKILNKPKEYKKKTKAKKKVVKKSKKKVTKKKVVKKKIKFTIEQIDNLLLEVLEVSPIEVEECIEFISEKCGLSKTLIRKQFEAIKKKSKKKTTDEQVEEILDDIKTDKPNIEPPKADQLPLNEEVLKKWQDTDLLDNIKAEISKDHLGDTNAKMTLNLIYTSGLLKNSKDHMSSSITADTSMGKDNLQKSNLKHFPNNSYRFITSATKAVVEDDIGDIPILAISELNLFREHGENKELLGVAKQRMEGGTSVFKKDKRDDNKSLREEKSEQGTTTFGTTDTERDKELNTRVINISIKSSYEKIKKVNENTFDNFADPTIITKDEKDSWIKKGLTNFWKKLEQYQILIPYATLLKDKINGEDIFDNSDGRSQRDIKRILSLTCAMTYLFQEQREKKEINGIKFLISEPIDLINTLYYSQEFFNQSYEGLDARLNDILKIIKQKSEEDGFEWVDRNHIEENLHPKVSKNTLKKYCKILSGEGLITGIKGSEIQGCQNSPYIIDMNRYYYKIGYQKGIKKPLIRCQLLDLFNYINKKFPLRDSKIYEKIVKKLDFDTLKLTPLKNRENSEKNPKIDTLLTPCLTPLRHPSDSQKEQLTQEEKNILKDFS